MTNIDTTRHPLWTYADICFFLFLALLSMVVGQLLVRGIALVAGMNMKNTEALLVPAQLVFYVLVFGSLYGLLRIQYGVDFWQSLAWVNPQQSAGAFLFAGVLLAFFVGLTATILRTPDTDTPLKHLLSNRGMAIQLAFIGTTIGPFCEELVFRGFLQPLLVSSMGRWAGILVTAFVFGVLHLAQNAFIWQSGLLIMIAGVAFGWIRQWTGSTKASTWTHMAYNSLFFFAFFATGRDLPK